ncbi:GHKL domain-containing protein [Trichococcus flocculiformis]|uniref:GHKL domain-containing protein n=1 Tax=Trichococcus flocculiformis TaxID=82803 RepID=UPI002AAC42B7|nr:GHKL domain-containing protein [Trichococcus flocculiformis]
MILNEVLPNIPRVYTALAEWLACVVIILPFSKKDYWIFKLASGGLVQILLQVLVGTWPLLFWIPGMIINVTWMLFVIYTTGNLRKYDVLYFGCKAFILAEFIASLTWQFYYTLILEEYGNNTFVSSLFMLTCYALLFSVFFFIDGRLTHKNMARQFTKRNVILAVLTAVIIFTVSNIGFILTNTSYPLGDTMAIFIFRTLINLCGICILFIQEYQKYESYLHEELSVINNTLQSQYEQYNAYKESSEIIQRQFHDLKHQLEMIRSEPDSRKREQHVEEMTHAINTYSATISTGNAILDTILTSKNAICIENGITFTCFADGKQLDNMDAMDICSLFGNALDNAIEAAKKIPDKEKRLIELRVAKKALFLVISLRNISFEKLAFENDLPITTKARKDLHGYGLKSIALITEKYQGTMTITMDENWFSLKVIIPVTENGIQQV